MKTPKKPSENSVSEEMIKRVHLTLADLRSGEEILNFLRTTEPLFMEEVNRFIQIEMSRMRFQLTESQALYIGSVIGATYIAGFLIAREATHQMFNGLLNFKSSIKSTLSQEELDRIIDKNVDDGRTYKEIAKLIKHMLERKDSIGGTKKKTKTPHKKKNGERFNLGDLS